MSTKIYGKPVEERPLWRPRQRWQ